MYRTLLVAVALMGVARSAAVAQTCTGLASYSRGPIQVAGHGAVVTSVGIHQVGASLGYGRPGGVFGDLDISRTSNGLDAYLNYGVDVGYQSSVGLVQVCPVAAFSIVDLPDNSGTNNTARTATFGFAMGLPFGTSQLQIVPTGALTFQYVGTTYGDAFGNSSTQSDAYGQANLGVGLIINSVSIRPDIAIPVGLTGADPVVGLTVGFNFGRKR
jgi:hypothetical protein